MDTTKQDKAQVRVITYEPYVSLIFGDRTVTFSGGTRGDWPTLGLGVYESPQTDEERTLAAEGKFCPLPGLRMVDLVFKTEEGLDALISNLTSFKEFFFTKKLQNKGAGDGAD